MNMNSLDHIITYVSPKSLLEGTPWLGAWEDKERREYVALAKLFFSIGAALYIAHYYLFDLPTGLEPKSHWFQFRASMTGLCLAAVAYYLTPLANRAYYRAPAIIVGLIACYTQARVSVWYPEAPWLYCFVFIIMITFVLQTSPVKSLAFASVCVALQWQSLLEAGVQTPAIISAFFVTCIMLLATRSAYISNIRFFLLTQQNTDAQRKNIEMNIEFTDRLKSFIPGQIAERLEDYLSDGRTTVLQAIDEVLRPKKQNIACLFSDIRGFTEASKDLDSYIGELVLPNIKACTHAVENNGGIPRKIGDLIFAYYDDRDQKRNVLRSILSGFDIATLNAEQNASTKKGEVKRFILISIGEAIVGNVGGFDSSVEITALGSPVNFLARVDELTKVPNIARQLENGDIIVCHATFQLLQDIGVQLETTNLELGSSRVKIRDFSEHTLLYSFRANEQNKDSVYEVYNSLDQERGTTSRENSGQAA